LQFPDCNQQLITHNLYTPLGQNYAWQSSGAPFMVHLHHTVSAAVSFCAADSHVLTLVIPQVTDYFATLSHHSRWMFIALCGKYAAHLNSIMPSL